MLQCAAIVLFALAHLAGLFMLADAGPTAAKFFHQYLDIDSEGTPGAYYSALGFLATALVAGHMAHHESGRSQRRFWAVTAFLLGFLSIDEAASIHEGFQVLGNFIVPRTGIFYFSWWAPYLLALAPVLAVMTPGLLSLPKQTRNTLVISGAIFLTGAVGVELIEAAAYDQIVSMAPDNPALVPLTQRFKLLAMVEECLELLAVALVLRALLRHAAIAGPDARIRIVDDLAGQRSAVPAPGS